MNRLLLLAPRIATNRLWARAGEVPSLHIAPARTQNARDLITGNLLGTYNSASPAWAVGPDGVLALPAANAPVIEYDPTTLSCLGARIWGVVTNDSKATEAIGGTGWTNQNSIGVSLNSTDVIDPAGGNKASKLTWGATNSQTLMPFTAAADVYSAGVWLRTLTGTANVTLFAFLQASPFTVIGAATVAVTSAWQRLSVTTSTATAAGYNFGIQLTGAGSVYAFGSQVNRGTILGPYVQNNSTTLAASSTADAWDITSLAAGINNLKTLYVRGRTQAFGTRGIASLNDNTANNRLELSTSGTTAKATAVTSAATVADLSGGIIAANTTFRLAARFDTDSYALSLNGGAVVTDTSGARVLVNRLFIGRDQAGNYQNGYIEEMAGWTKPCADGQLSALAAS